MLTTIDFSLRSVSTFSSSPSKSLGILGDF